MNQFSYLSSGSFINIDLANNFAIGTGNGKGPKAPLLLKGLTVKKNTGREKLGKEAYDNTANMVDGFILDNVDITEYAFAGAIPIIVEGVAEALVATGIASMTADMITEALKAYANGPLAAQQKVAGIIVLGNVIQAWDRMYSKGGKRNVWPDGQYPKPDLRDVDWRKGDQELADGITGKGVPRGSKTPNNEIKKWFRDKRPKP